MRLLLLPHLPLPLFLLFLLPPPTSTSISWLALSMSSSSTSPSSTSSKNRLPPSAVCRQLPGLNRRQVKFCRRNLDSMESIRVGARDAYAECQHQFHKRRWNCTMIDPGTNTVFGDVVLKEGTREAAFVHAISAAGVAYRITKDCSRGLIDKCGCDLSHNGHSMRSPFISTSPTNGLDPSAPPQNVDGAYSYKGCSDNVHYGIAMSAEFVDAAEKNKNHSQVRRLMNEHNNRAGREVLVTAMRRECKCHGVSGACEMKTCWDAMPPFREVGNIIKDKFDGATEVKIVSSSPSSEAEEGQRQARPRMERKNPHFKRHTSADLVYIDASPDFCERDEGRGVLGTGGRQCNISSLAVDGCDLLCCHRGYNKEVRIVQERCHCKFHYCCRVECKTCDRVIEEYTCK